MVDAVRRIVDAHLCRCDRDRCLPAYLEGHCDIPKLLTEGEGTRNAAGPGLREVANLLELVIPALGVGIISCSYPFAFTDKAMMLTMAEK